jgi:hypothetical protein
MIQSNLEQSIIKVNRLIKDGVLNHPEVKKLIQNLVIYDLAYDEYQSELEMANLELIYKLELYKKALPDSYFIISPEKTMMVEPNMNLVYTF